MSKRGEKVVVPTLRFPEFQDQWDEAQLGELGEFTGGGTPSKNNDSYWKGNIPWVSSSDVYEESIHEMNISRFITEEALRNSATKRVPENSILLVSRVGVGKLAIAKESVCTSQDFTSFTPIKDNLLFLGYFLKTRGKALLGYSQGMAIKGFTKEDISRLAVAFPSSDEQKKIADCLTSIDELITTQIQKMDALKAHKKGLMQQLFPAEGETLPKLRFPEFRVKEEWEEHTLESVARYRRGSFPQPYGLPEWYDDENGMPFIQVYDVSDDMKLKAETKRKISELAARQSVFIRKGTIIITIQGSIGRVAVTDYDAYIDRTLLLFQEFLEPIEKIFFAYTIQTLFEIERQKAPGGIIKTITKEALSSFVIELPSISEQQKIADCLTSIDELITAQAQKVEMLKAQKKGLMQQLFPAMDKVNI